MTKSLPMKRLGQNRSLPNIHKDATDRRCSEESEDKLKVHVNCHGDWPGPERNRMKLSPAFMNTKSLEV